MLLEVGTKAPAFTLPDQNGTLRSLSDFLGKKVVLYFYPKDSTPGCTRQALAFGALEEDFARENAVILGISKDSVASHQRFAQKNSLPFLLLADPDLAVLQAYGVWQEKRLYGKVSMGTVRTTYLIDEEGVIQQVYPKVKPEENPKEVLALLRGERA